MHPMITVLDPQKTCGFMKDAVALVGFVLLITALVIRGNAWCPKRILIILLIGAIILDGIFTLNPTWHHTRIGTNFPTAFVTIQLIIVVGCGVSLITGVR